MNLKTPIIATLGILIASTVFAEKPKKGEISMKKARAIATQAVAGKIKSEEFEFEKGQDVYSFDIAGDDNKIHEVLVGAKSGKIVSNSIETAAKEAAEARADQQQKK